MPDHTMDPVSRAMYEYKFELAFLKKSGDEFQDFFSDIMEKKYPGDFQRVRPWGREGDRKNDGYRWSTRTLFAVYAPNEMRADRCVAKVDSDFRGALPHWEEHFSTWVFVHNSRLGLSAPVLTKLRELADEHDYLQLDRLGYQELHNEVFELDRYELANLFGPALARRDMLAVDAGELRTLLDMVALARAPDATDLRPVPSGKVDYNRLSSFVDTLLQAGRTRAPLVERVLKHYMDPAIGERIAAGFRARYEIAREAGLSPDEIFNDLQQYAGGALRGPPQEQAATLAILAYYFDSCDIFERPEEEETA